MKTNNRPEIRFKMFTGEWKQRRLGIMYDIVSGYAFKKNDYTQEGIPIINGESIQHNNISTQNLNFLPVSFLDSYQNVILRTDDIVLALNRPITNGNLKIAQIPKNLDSSLLYQRAGKIVILNNTNIDFSYQLLLNEVYEFVLKKSVGSDQPFISTLNLKKWLLFTPDSEVEEERIGSFFKQLDNNILFQQQELDNLKQTKQGFLQKMFPKKGEFVPELRFPGFNREWIERKLFDVADMFNNLRVPVKASDRIEGSIPYYGANGIQDYVEGYTHDGEFVLMAEDGASDLINYPVNYVNGKVWVNNHAHVISGHKDIINNLFLLIRINSMNIIPYLVGGSRTKLNAATLKKIPIIIPCFEEQTKIGNFFKQLDETIALLQQELESLQETKKAFLQKMFV